MTSVEIICLTVICYVLIFFGVATNGSLLVVFMRSKRLRSAPSNKLICSLLLSDVLIELGIAVTIPITEESLTRKIAFLLRMVSKTITVLNLCSIWVDRIVTLKLSFMHHVLIDNKIVTKALIVIWGSGLALVASSAVMFSFQMDSTAYRKWRYVTSVFTIVGFVVLIVGNVIIFREARMQFCKINRQNMRLRRKFLTLQMKSTYVCIFMVTAFLIFWFPYLVENAGQLVHGEAFRKQWFSLFCALMIICNTVIHPCLYILLNRETRKLILRRWRRSRSSRLGSKSKKPVKSQKSLSSSVFTISMREINDVQWIRY